MAYRQLSGRHGWMVGTGWWNVDELAGEFENWGTHIWVSVNPDFSSGCCYLIVTFRAFTDLFNQDKIKFGDPYASGRKVVDVRDLDNWQIVLQTHAKTVEAKVQKKRKVVPI